MPNVLIHVQGMCHKATGMQLLLRPLLQSCNVALSINQQVTSVYPLPGVMRGIRAMVEEATAYSYNRMDRYCSFHCRTPALELDELHTHTALHTETSGDTHCAHRSTYTLMDTALHTLTHNSA